MSLFEIPPRYLPGLLLMAVLVVTFSCEVPLTVDIAATTEVATATLQGEDLRWQLPDVEIRHRGDPAAFTGSFRPAPDVEVTFRRAGSDRLNVYLQAGGSGRVGTLEADGGSAEDIHGTLRIYIPASSRVTLPVEGKMRLGAELMTDQQRPALMLDQGRVRLLGLTLFQRKLFDGGSYELTAGDFVSAGGPVGQGIGFVTPAERGLRVGYRIVAHRVEVSRFRATRPYEIGVPWTDRIAKDGDFQKMMAFMGILASIWLTWIGRTASKAQRMAAAIFVCFTAAESALGEVVLLESEQSAQGITFAHQGDCLIAAPAHAVLTPDGVRVSNQRAQGRAALLQKLADDIAVLRIDSGGPQFCREPWPVHEYREDAPAPPDLQIRTVKPNGVLASMRVVQEHATYRGLTLRPAQPGEEFQETMSGSAVVGGNRVIGMLMSVTNGKANALRLGYIDNILQHYLASRQSSNLSGIWSLVPEVGGRMRGGEETLVRVDHLGNEVKVWLHQPGPDLGESQGWVKGMKIWDGVLDGSQGTVSGYGRLPGSAASGDAYRNFVPFRGARDGDTIATELVLAERAAGNTGIQISTRKVTLHRFAEVNSSARPNREPGVVAPAQSTRPNAVASGQDALRILRAAFSKLGYQDIPGPQGVPIRYETSVRHFDERNCELVMEERMHVNPSRPYTQRNGEVTYLRLASIDADQVRAFSEQMGPFPPNSWFIRVPAAGPAIRVQAFEGWTEQLEPRGETKPDEVFFYLRYPQLAEEAADALRALAQACGAR